MLSKGVDFMNMSRPAVLDSEYVVQNEKGEDILLENAPPDVVAAFNEYKKSINGGGFVENDDLPPIPPLNK